MPINLIETFIQNHEHRHGHKDMTGGEFPFTSFLEQHHLTINFDPTREGGLIFLIFNEESLPVGYVRGPFWRGEENSPSITSADVRPLFIRPKERVESWRIESGGEFEMLVWDPRTSDLAPVLGKGSPIPSKLDQLNNGNEFQFHEEDPLFEELNPRAKEIGYSPEAATACIEINFHHAPNPQQRALAMTRALKYLMRFIEEEGWYMTPIAAIPHRPLTPQDINPHPYIQRIAMEYMGWENVRHFLGSSWQVHVEMLDLKSALTTINMYQLIAPLLSALSSASPFIHGETNPNLAKIYREDETSQMRLNDRETYEALNSTDWLSIRYPSRWRGSPSGGTFVKPLPENPEDFFRLAELGLKDNDPRSAQNIPSPARAAGHHRDRIRIDIGPNGTLEISNMDTFGGHVLKLAAVQEFTRVLIWKMQYFAKANRLPKLVHQYPNLFKYPITEEMLREAHLYSIQVAKQGMDANNARSLFIQLLQFVKEPLVDRVNSISYHGLPPKIIEELMKSAEIPTDEDFSPYRDSDGITSITGFYQSGKGTLAHWLKQRAFELRQKGLGNHELSNHDIIVNCMNDLGTSYHLFLKKLNPQQVVDLFM